VVAPASPFPRADFEAGVSRLRERYRVSWDEGIFARDGYLAGSDARRLAELRAALSDPDVDALVAARGGYGVTRLLDRLGAEEVAAAPKLLVGFSDLTALHALWARAGLRSLHGPMVAALGRAEPAWVERWIGAVEGEPMAAATGLTALSPGVAEGPLVGGNLAVLAALCGTPHAPPLDGAILLLEDVGEAPYRVDRMLTTLRHAGWLERVAAVVLGLFTACDPRPDGRTVTEVVRERLGDLRVPVVAGLNAGHEPDNVEIPLGARARVDADRGVLTFLEGAVARP
jgi:muramoyltetrapeptide carboxypeptidase